MGTKLPFCILRGTTFYWRRRLPRPFKMSVEFSLGTKDLRVARGLSFMLTIETDRAFAVLREGKMTPEQVDTFARQKFTEHSAKLSAVHQLALDRHTPWQDEIVATRAAAIAMSLLAHHGRSAQLSDFPGITNGEFGADVMQRSQAMLETFSRDYWSDVRAKRLQSDLAAILSLTNPSPLDVAEARSATLEAYAAAGAATAAKFSATPKSLDDLLSLASRFSDLGKAPPASVVTSERGAGSAADPVTPDLFTTMQTASTVDAEDACCATEPGAPDQSHDDIMAFARSSAAFDLESKAIRASTASQKLQVFALFIAVTGKSTFQALHQADVKKFVNVMAMLPKVRGRSVAEQGATVEELLAKGRALPKNEVGLSAATVNRNLSYLTKLMRQARMAGLEGLPQLEISGFRMKKRGKVNEKRPAYSASDVETLFKYTIWTGCRSAARRHIPGNHIVWDGLYWCPLISAYSGARLEEIAALSLAEVILDHTVPHFVFRENESRGLKTVASERKVPIHPALIELGFIRYVSNQKKLKTRDLFPDLRPNAGTKTSWGDRTHYGFNIAVANALGAARVQNDKNKTFHSFRHYICTELGRFTDLKDKTIQDIVGHENVGTTDRIYKDPTELEVMLEAMSRLPGLTKAALKASGERKIIPARRKAIKTQV